MQAPCVSTQVNLSTYNFLGIDSAQPRSKSKSFGLLNSNKFQQPFPRSLRKMSMAIHRQVVASLMKLGNVYRADRVHTITCTVSD